MPGFLKQGEKKVEYIELIYDLIFVYIIGRNNSLVQHTVNGTLDPELYLTYTLCTLITIQIWYSTTLFINRYGTNSFSEYIGLFINMYLLYYMADGTRPDWAEYYYRYNAAWFLILVNLIVQYLLKYRKINKAEFWRIENIKENIRVLAIEAGLILIGAGVYALTGIPASPAAMICGIILSLARRKKNSLVALDFTHLTERVMLFVVFTFGEMIIAIASYFSGETSLGVIYFSGMAFLVVVGLFMSYGFLYDRLLNRQMHVNGNGYMILHIFLIFSLSNLTNAMEFMREPEADVVFKNIYLTASFICYYVFLFFLAPYTKGYRRGRLRSYWTFGICLTVYMILMILFYRAAYLTLLLSVLLNFSVGMLEYRYWKNSPK